MIYLLVLLINPGFSMVDENTTIIRLLSYNYLDMVNQCSLDTPTLSFEIQNLRSFTQHIAVNSFGIEDFL